MCRDGATFMLSRPRRRSGIAPRASPDLAGRAADAKDQRCAIPPAGMGWRKETVLIVAGGRSLLRGPGVVFNPFGGGGGRTRPGEDWRFRRRAPRALVGPKQIISTSVRRADRKTAGTRMLRRARGEMLRRSIGFRSSSLDKRRSIVQTVNTALALVGLIVGCRVDNRWAFVPQGHGVPSRSTTRRFGGNDRGSHTPWDAARWWAGTRSRRADRLPVGGDAPLIELPVVIAIVALVSLFCRLKNASRRTGEEPLEPASDQHCGGDVPRGEQDITCRWR